MTVGLQTRNTQGVQTLRGSEEGDGISVEPRAPRISRRPSEQGFWKNLSHLSGKKKKIMLPVEKGR